MTAVNTTITSIDLSLALLDDSSMKWIAKILEENITLKELYLSESNIHDEGIEHIMNALVKNNTLKILDISYINITVQCIPSIFNMIRYNQGITDLFFDMDDDDDDNDDNHIDEMQMILESFQHNTTLLYVDHKEFKKELSDDISKFMHRNQMIHQKTRQLRCNYILFCHKIRNSLGYNEYWNYCLKDIFEYAREFVRVAQIMKYK